MVLSMTGFGSGTVEIKTAHGNLLLAVEMKTVNSRYFEATCKLPVSLSSLEIKIVNVLQPILRRGRLYMVARFADDSEVVEHIKPSLSVIKQYVDAVKLIKDKNNISGDLTISDILELPNIFELNKSELTEEEEGEILNGISKIAEQVNSMRAQEGARLEQDIAERFLLCSKKMSEINFYFEKVMKEQKDLVDKQLALSHSGDEQAKMQVDDLCSTLNKMDIHEEITRFNSHLASVGELFKAPRVVDKGKRLDFILQELLREVNTLMAKCSHFTISSLSVDIKVELEKAREQIQNIV